MELVFKLETFEGPLDLLLHLIEKNKMDIFDIRIAEITEQYLEYIRQMQQQDMNIMSEFLVMAATLLDIKSRMLLPREKTEEGEEIDPRSELVEQLLQYKMAKYMAYELKDRQMDAEHNFYKEKATIPKEILEYKEPVNYEKLMGDMTLKKLNSIFQEMMRRTEERIDPIRSKFGNVEKDEIQLEGKTNYIIDYLNSHEKCSFRELLEKQHSKLEMIVTFLVILELMKIGSINVVQDETFADIMIERAVASEAVALSEDFSIV